MRWITALQLETWARSLASEVKLPEIVGDLILATAAEITDIRFPSGDKGRVRGFDGNLFSKTAALNVPEGRSLWEFGTDQDYKAKAKEDFDKRTSQVSPEEQKNITLVLVTPWSWDSSRVKLEEWIQERKTTAAWKDLIVIDGVRLQAWLDYRPAVAARHARATFGIGQNGGIRSTDEFWADFTGQFSPPLTEDVLLCERESFAQQVLDRFLKPPFVLSFVADTADEVVAFAIAAIRKAPEEVRAHLELRTLVVDTREAGRMLPHDENTILLLRGDATRSPTQFSQTFSTLVPLSRPVPRQRP
nr:hypothetical protein [uncultured Acidocella sp.]